MPFGSYPGNMPYEYFSDEEHLREWLRAEKEMAGYMSFLERHLFGVGTFADYLETCGGLERLRWLRNQEWLLDGPGASTAR